MLQIKILFRRLASNVFETCGHHSLAITNEEIEIFLLSVGSNSRNLINLEQLKNMSHIERNSKNRFLFIGGKAWLVISE